jgi:hypothetical protein
VLLRNDGTGRLIDRSTILPREPSLGRASAVLVTDVDDDGTRDITAIDAGGAPRPAAQRAGQREPSP